jgi:uncharacterized protein
MRSLTPVALGALLGCGDNGTVMGRDAATDTASDVPVDGVVLGNLDGFCSGQAGKPRVLVYAYENQWRHLSNVYARAAFLDMCTTRGLNVDASNDPKVFNSVQLVNYDVVVFSVTSGSGISEDGKAAFEAWVRDGGGYVGLEAAASTEQAWSFYVQNVGAEFLAHPPTLEPGTIRFSTTSHPIIDGLPASLDIVEQWYVFRERPENVPGQTVLMTLDETTLPSTHPQEQLIGYHAYAWVHERFGGRSFYTGLGDNPDIFSDETILELLGRAIEWTAHQR